MQVKLLRPLLIGGGHLPSPTGTVVDVPDEEARHYIDTGLAEAADGASEPANASADEAERAEAERAAEVRAKAALSPDNKMATDPLNKKA